MQQLSLVKAELLDQYLRYVNSIRAYKEKIEEQCVAGCISAKSIRGKKYYYLQWRENGKLISKYILPEHVDALNDNIELRKRYESIIKDMKVSISEIERFIGKRNIESFLKRHEEEH